MSQAAPMRNVCVLLLTNRYGEFLLGRRAEGKFAAGFWELPGGKQEEGEDLLSCLQREIKEEIAYNVSKSEIALIHRTEVPYTIGNVPLHVFAARLNKDGVDPDIMAQSEDNERPALQALEQAELRWVDGAGALNLPLLPIMREMLDLQIFRERISNINIVDTTCDSKIKL